MRQILLAGQPTVNERRLLLNYITLSTGNLQDYKVCFLDHSCCVFFMFQLCMHACSHLQDQSWHIVHQESTDKFESMNMEEINGWICGFKYVATALKDYDLCVVVKKKETVCNGFTAIFLALHIGISESRESCELTWLLSDSDWIS